MEEGPIYDRGGVWVDVFPVDHGIVKWSVGFRFTYFERDWEKGAADICKGRITVGRGLMVL